MSEAQLEDTQSLAKLQAIDSQIDELQAQRKAEVERLRSFRARKEIDERKIFSADIIVVSAIGDFAAWKTAYAADPRRFVSWNSIVYERSLFEKTVLVDFGVRLQDVLYWESQWNR